MVSHSTCHFTHLTQELKKTEGSFLPTPYRTDYDQNFKTLSKNLWGLLLYLNGKNIIYFYDHKNNFKVRICTNHHLSKRFNKKIRFQQFRTWKYLVVFGQNQEIPTIVNCKGELWGELSRTKRVRATALNARARPLSSQQHTSGASQQGRTSQ